MTTVKVNPHRPYYTPGLTHHNYTSLSSDDAIPLTIDIPHNSDLKSFTYGIANFISSRYFVTTLTSPFEVGTTLLQVQYSPHEDIEVLGLPVQSQETTKSSTSFHNLDMDTDSEDEGGFYKRPEERTSIDSIRIRTENYNPVSIYDDKNRPPHQMAPMEGGGVLEILSSIVKHPTEGWKSLFKGQRVAWIYDMLRNYLRPALENTLNDLFGLYDDSIPLSQLASVTPNITTMVVSHLVIGFLLSPLEIVRTRLVVQSASPLCQKYKGTMHALNTMIAEEGGLKGIYLSKNLIPTLFYHTITPLMSCSTPLIIARVLRISPADSPLLYGVADLTLSIISLLITLPLETIRKRLQCQVPGHDFKSTVPIRPQPYRGFLDALYRILKEEGTRHKRSQTKKVIKKEWLDSSDSETEDLFTVQKNTPPITSAWGIRGLYRGFNIQLSAVVVLFVMKSMNGFEDGISGWI